jgi:hypothetical protein
LALKLNPVDVGIRLLNELEFEDEYTRIYWTILMQDMSTLL